MRRLARHLFTLCAAVSLVPCVAVCVLWARSNVNRDAWRSRARDVHWWVTSQAGVMRLDNEPQRACDRLANHHRAMALRQQDLEDYRRAAEGLVRRDPAATRALETFWTERRAREQMAIRAMHGTVSFWCG